MEHDLRGATSPPSGGAMGYELPTAKIAGGIVAAAIAALLLFALGLVIAHRSIDSGIDDFQHDRIAHAVAKKAHEVAWVHVDNPIQRLLMPAAKVVLVEPRAGHCNSVGSSDGAANMNVPRDPRMRLRADPGVATLDPSWAQMREYVARVRFYTSFGIPAVAVSVTCKGASYEPLS